MLPSEGTLFDAKKIFLFCEGRTEYNYFTGLTTELRSSRIEVVPRYPDQEQGEGTDIKKLVEQVLGAIRTGTVRVDREGHTRERSVQDIDEFKVLFDRDTNFRPVKRTGRSKYDDAVDMIRGNRIDLFLSNYSFEVWILCHFTVPDRVVKSTALQYEIRNVAHWDAYRKNDREIFRKLMDRLDDALVNAAKLLERKRGIKIHSEESDPVTEVGHLVDHLLSQMF